MTLKSSHSTNDDTTLPDWCMMTDCSAFGQDCVIQRLQQHQYAEYPFQFVKEYNHLYVWQAELPQSWEQSLQTHIPRNTTNSKLKKNDPLEITKCVQAMQAKTVEVQLEELLEILERVNDMVAFTIADYSYTHDMMQDVFEMAHNVIGFNKAFFMVTMDVATMELACQHHNKFLAWPQRQDSSTLKGAIASTKFYILHALAK